MYFGGNVNWCSVEDTIGVPQKIKNRVLAIKGSSLPFLPQ